jgi:DNA repair protein RadC
VSVAIAQELLRAFGSLDGVFAASKEALSAVKVGKQSFGKVKAERLHGLMHSLLPMAKDSSTKTLCSSTKTPCSSTKTLCSSTKTTGQTEQSSSSVAAAPSEHTTECD